jgi:hypothetical protein
MPVARHSIGGWNNERLINPSLKLLRVIDTQLNRDINQIELIRQSGDRARSEVAVPAMESMLFASECRPAAQPTPVHREPSSAHARYTHNVSDLDPTRISQ